MSPDTQLFTEKARRRLLTAYKNDDFIICERGVLDMREGVKVSDETLIELLVQCGINIQEALTTSSK